MSNQNGLQQVGDATAMAASETALPASKALSKAVQGASVLAPGQRDLRLDLFRGIALWLIYLDHIPSNIVNRFTLRNYGFSDATEIFIFISGYTAAYVYGRAMREQGFVISGARILRRAWQIYVAHIFLFAIYLAEISYVASNFANPLYAEEMNIVSFLSNPDTMIVQALLLKFKPVNMDVLPLYIVLLFMFPPILWLLLRRPTLALGLSSGLYTAARIFSLNLPAYPGGVWYFNPFAWQLLFVFGAWCATGGAARHARIVKSPWTLLAACGYLLFAMFIALSWRHEALREFVPQIVQVIIEPVSKTNLSLLRLFHFFAIAVVVVGFVPLDWPALKSPWLRPAIVCGQHSLEIFCLGVFLAFAAHFVVGEFSGAITAQVLVSINGILIMILTAGLISWYKEIEGRQLKPQKKDMPDADLAGGEV